MLDDSFRRCPITHVFFETGSQCQYLNNSFTSCNKLKYAELVPTVQYIGSHTFAYCSNLETVLNMDNVIAIGSQAFNSTTKLNMATLPEKLTYIGEKAFLGCSNVTFSSIPIGMT
jgi:hypothetical protein